MARVDLDLSDLERWREDIRLAGAVVYEAAHAVVKKGAQNILTEARANAPSGRHAPRYPASISYDVEPGVPGEIVAEIGPQQGRDQWGLGNLLEYGSENNPPHPHLEPALDHEEPRFYAWSEKLAASCVESPRAPIPKLPSHG